MKQGQEYNWVDVFDVATKRKSKRTVLHFVVEVPEDADLPYVENQVDRITFEVAKSLTHIKAKRDA